jgi:hypothetical protein
MTTCVKFRHTLTHETCRGSNRYSNTRTMMQNSLLCILKKIIYVGIYLVYLLYNGIDRLLRSVEKLEGCRDIRPQGVFLRRHFITERRNYNTNCWTSRFTVGPFVLTTLTRMAKNIHMQCFMHKTFHGIEPSFNKTCPGNEPSFNKTFPSNEPPMVQWRLSSFRGNVAAVIAARQITPNG